MYENFVLRELKDGKIQGYLWDVKDPDRVVCIVHGIGEYGGRFDRVAEAFRKENTAVIAMDLRGHGDSAGPKGHCAPRSDVLMDIDHLIGYAVRNYPEIPLVLYGHSMGGNIVLHYRAVGTLNDVPSAYMISAPWITLVRSIPKPVYHIARGLAKAAPKLAFSSSVNEADLGNPESVQPYNDDPMVQNTISIQCAVDGFKAGMKLEKGELKDNMRAAGIPTLIMHGSADKICSIEGTEKAVKRLEERGDNVEYVRWEGLFHEIHNGNETSNGDEVIEKMISWMKGVDQQAKKYNSFFAGQQGENEI